MITLSLQVLSASDALFTIDLPVIYGEEEFLQRIEERTLGVRPPLGLVLSGGSARAFAHLGVLEYLEQVGIVPDFIISNSMGSIVGMLYGAGFSPQQIYELFVHGSESSLFSLGIPLSGGVLDTSTFISLISKAVGEDLQMEQLPIPVMVLAEDLRTKRQIRIASGDFLTVLQASFALPFYFSPVFYGDHLLIDGGFTNLVPVQAGRDYADQVIVATTFYQNPNLNLRSPLTILNVALDITKARRGIEELKKLDHILIRSQVEEFSFMEFDRIDELREAGFTSAREQFDPAAHGLDSHSHTLPSTVISLRTDYEKRIAEIPGMISRRGYVPLSKSSFSLSPFLSIGAHQLDRRYLQRGVRFGLKANVRKGNLLAALYGGGSYDAAGEKEMAPILGSEFHAFSGKLASLTAGIQYYPPSNGYAYVFGDIGHSLSQWSDIQGGSGIEARWDGDEIEELLVTTWVGLSGRTPLGVNYALEGGHQLSREQQQVLFGDGSLLWRPNDMIGVKPRLLYKQGLSDASVQFYPREGLLLQPPIGSSRGWITSLDLTAHLDEIRPTFAEMIMVRGVHAGVFGEAGVVDSLLWSAGIRVGTRVSLIGLEELALQLTVGYDSVSSKVRTALTVQM